MAFPSDLEIARGGAAQAARRHRRARWASAHAPARAVRRERGEDQAGRDRRAGRPAEGQVRRGHRDHADAARRGQDHHDGRARARRFRHIGKRATVAIRQPSMGPTFGIKGGAAGGGYSQVVPMEVLNLHLTGDMHAVTAAHNLLSAMIDNHLYQGNELGLDLHNITWRRVLDVNDRALRNIVIGLGSRRRRRAAADRVRHHRRLRGDGDAGADHARWPTCARGSGRIVVGYTRPATPVTAEQLSARRVDGRDHARRDQAEPAADAGEHAGAGARRAVRQHRHRQLLGRRRPDRHPRRRLPDHRGRVRRRHGRGAVLQHQVPRRPGLRPGRRGGGRHGAGAEGALRQVQDRRRASRCPTDLLAENPDDVLRRRGQPAQADRERAAARRVPGGRHQRLPDRPSRPSTTRSARSPRRRAPGPRCAPTSPTAAGARPSWPRRWPRPPTSPATSASSTRTRRACGRRSRPSRPRSTAPTASSYSPQASKQLDTYEQAGFGTLPVCIAKTHLSISSDPTLKGAPTGWTLPVREVRASVGAGFVYPICGEMRTMPGLGTNPAAARIDIDEDGEIVGLS